MTIRLLFGANSADNLLPTESQQLLYKKSCHMNRVCVFCGSKAGTDELYHESAAELGRLIVQQGYGLVYGGGSVGLMRFVADAALEAGGEVIGVIPEPLATKELLHPDVPDMRVVANMHERKALMSELSDAFVALPGGLGTFEEFFEIVTWAQLGFHRKNTGLLNVAGFFDPLIELIDHSIRSGFIEPNNHDLIVVENDPETLLERLRTHQLPKVRRWLGPETT